MTDAAGTQNAYGQPVGPALPEYAPRPLPPTTPLQGRYVRLEPIAAAHADDLYEAFMDAPDGRAFTYLFEERPVSVADMRARVERMAASPDPRHHAAVDVTTGRAVGHAALMRIDPLHGVMELGHVAMSPRLQRTRMATETVRLFLGRAFDDLGYRRFEWKCDALNAPSRRAAERFGFTYEGTFRQAVVYKQRSRDTAWYSIIDREWPALRAGYEAWLDPANFDERDQQRRTLRECRGLHG